MPTLDEQDALAAEEKKVVAAKPADAAVPTVSVDGLYVVDSNDNWELKGAVGSDAVEHVGVKHKLRELLEKYCAKRRKILTSVADSFKLVSRLLGSVEAFSSMAEHATCLLRGDEPEVGPKSMTINRDENFKAVADAQVKEI